MGKPSIDQSVAHEPHLQDGFRLTDESEEKAEKTLSKRKKSLDQKVEHTVWDEPALSGELVKTVPSDALSYNKWLKEKIEQTTSSKSWYITLLLILASGPWAVLGAFMLAFQGHGGFGSVAVVIFGPVIEEILKISSTLVTIENRPYFFKSPKQIFLCCVLSGLVFAFIENIIYLYIYISDPTPLVVIWRWSVCVLLHSSCTAISSVGLIKIWSSTMRNYTRPRLSHMAKYIIAACIIHGSYNFIASLISPFFE